MIVRTIKDIKKGDKLMLSETGFEYPVLWVSDKSVLIKMNGENLFIPKSVINIFNSSLTSLQFGYVLYKLGGFPQWYVTKNNIH